MGSSNNLNPKQASSRKRPEQRLPLNYYRSKNKSQFGNSPFEKKPAKRSFKPGKILSRTADIALVALLVFILGYSLIVRPEPAVVVNGTTFHPASYYQAAVQKQLGGLRNANKITFNEASIINNLQAKYPEISQASIDLPLFGQKPKVNLTISEPAFQLKDGTKTFLVNGQGTALPIGNRLSQTKDLKIVDDQSGFKTVAGKQVLSSSSVAFIETVIKHCQKANIPISTLILPPTAQELDLKTSDRPYFVKFFIGGNANMQTGQYLAARHRFDQSGPQPASYLDVRVNGKVYYK